MTTNTLGRLCHRKHDHRNTGRSMRNSKGHCVACAEYRVARAQKRAAAVSKEAPPAKPLHTQPRYFRLINKVVTETARKCAGFTSSTDLAQEGWTWAIPAFYRYFDKFEAADRSDAGLRGWIYRCIYCKLATYSRKATCPVSFPKKAVPARIKEGVHTVTLDNAHNAYNLQRTVDVEGEYLQAERKHAVDVAMGRVLTQYPMAALTLEQASSVAAAAAKLEVPEPEVRRQTKAARRALKELLLSTLHEGNA